MAGKSTVDSY